MAANSVADLDTKKRSTTFKRTTHRNRKDTSPRQASVTTWKHGMKLFLENCKKLPVHMFPLAFGCKASQCIFRWRIRDQTSLLGWRDPKCIGHAKERSIDGISLSRTAWITYQSSFFSRFISLACVSSETIICNAFFAPGSSPLYRVYGYVPRQKVCFFSCFGLKLGINFDHFGLK